MTWIHWLAVVGVSYSITTMILAWVMLTAPEGEEGPNGMVFKDKDKDDEISSN